MNIISIGFPQALIPIIEREWEATVRGDSDCIEFLASSREGGFYNSEFKLAGCIWQYRLILSPDHEVVTEIIELIKGQIDEESLTFAILKDKIEST